LLEVLVAAFLLSVGLLGALEAIARCSASARGAEDRARAMLVARAKMEEILKEPQLQTGTDRGEGTDTSTDYDWQVDIEPSQNASLVTVTVVAKNRITGLDVALTALRRPDIQNPPATSGTSSSGEPGSSPPPETGLQ
jgi:type II secretory pathway component PulJ